MKKVEYNTFSKFVMPHSVKSFGKDFYFCVKSVDLKGNKYLNNLYVYKDNKVKKLTSKGDVSKFYTLQDGIYFISNREEDKSEDPKTYIYRLPYDMGEAELFLTLDYEINDIKFINSNKFYFTANYNFTYEKFKSENKNNKEKISKLMKEEKDYEVVNEVPFYFNGAGFINGNRSHLYTYNKGNIKKITTDVYENIDLASLKGDRLYFIKNTFNSIMSNFNKVYKMDNLDSTPEDISLKENASYWDAFCLPDGKEVILACLAKEHGFNENPKLFVREGQNQYMFNKEGLHSFNSSTLSDIMCEATEFGSDYLYKDNTLYFMDTNDDTSNIIGFNLITKEETVVTNVKGNIYSLDLYKEGFIVSALYEGVQDIYYVKMDGTTKKLTHFNDKVMKEYAFSKPEVLIHKNEVGDDIKGWVIKPYGYEKGKKYPMVLDIHGGPKCAYTAAYFHEMQLWSSKGYFVCFCNPNGSDGKGDLFMDIFGHYGDQDYKDIMGFLDDVLKENIDIDKEHLYVTGGSYGGFMTNWIIGHTDRFKAAASQRSISNWTSFLGTSDIGYMFVDDQTKSNPWDNLESCWNQSPLKYAMNCKTPTLFIHSDQDYRCPLEQGMQMFTAIRKNGVDARMCIFHGENHELSRSGKPQHRVRRLKEITEWFEKHK